MLRTLAAATTLALLFTAPAAGQRLTDDDVKALSERIYNERDRFEDALDGDFKHAKLRTASGEYDINRFLDDFQERANEYKERLTPSYAASREAAELLKQSSQISGYMKRQAPTMKGMSEWNKLEGSLGQLATAYGTTFPLPEGAAVRRIGDGELKAAVDGIEQDGKNFKKALEKDLKADKTVAPADRATAIGEADAFAKGAKALKDRVGDGKPSTAEAQHLFQQAAKIKEFMGSRSLPSAGGAWGGVGSKLATVAQAYGMSMP
jgi:hypothetical protein